MTVGSITWFQNILSNIQNEVNVIDNLSEFKIRLIALNSSQLPQIAQSLDLTIIFDSINSSDK